MTCTRAPSRLIFDSVVHAHDFAIEPDAQITLLLEEIEKIPRLGFRRTETQNVIRTVFADAVAQNLVRDRLRGFRSISRPQLGQNACAMRGQSSFR